VVRVAPVNENLLRYRIYRAASKEETKLSMRDERTLISAKEGGERGEEGEEGEEDEK
jgi:hypothetical protein